jgi:hypothetical protein
MIRQAGTLLTNPLTRRLVPRSAFHSVATSTTSGTSVSLRNVPRIALVGARAFGTERGSGSDDKPKPKHDKDLTNIYIQNQIWKQGKLDEDEDFFKKLGSGHAVSDVSTGWLDVRLLRESPSQRLYNIPHNFSLFESRIICGSVSPYNCKCVGEARINSSIEHALLKHVPHNLYLIANANRLLRRSCPCQRDHGRGPRIRLCRS